MRISGIFTQFAAATAAKGTKRPTIGDMVYEKRVLVNQKILKDQPPKYTLVRLFNPRAVTRAPLVARTYDVPNCLLDYETKNKYSVE